MNYYISFECLQAVAVYAFLLVMISAFIKYLAGKDDKEKNLQKVVGGMAVFIIAIISKNGWVFSVSIFIGGLIITSEEFMEKLAIIFRSRSEHIGQNLKTEPATKNDITKKEEVEIEELKKCSKEKDIRIKKMEENRKKAKNIEKKALNFLTFKDMRSCDHREQFGLKLCKS